MTGRHEPYSVKGQGVGEQGVGGQGVGGQDPYYVRYDGDFGLSGLAEAFALAPAPEHPRAARGLVTAKLDAYDRETPVGTVAHLGADERRILGFDTSHDEWGYADDLRTDVRTLLDASLPDETIRLVWRAAAEDGWDPAEHGMSAGDWLRSVEEICAAREPRRIPGRRPAPSALWDARPPSADAVRGDVVAEIRACRERPAGSRPAAPARLSPDILSALEEVAVPAPELAFRLLLRTLKACAVRIDKERHDRFHALADGFGHHAGLVDTGLDVAWAPLDPARRDTTWDFGLSALAGKAREDWAGRREDIRAQAEADDIGQTPGSAAAVLLDDVLRLLRSQLTDAALSALWCAAADRPRGTTGGREWLRLIAEVCRVRLREAAPAYVPVVPPVRAGLDDSAPLARRGLDDSAALARRGLGGSTDPARQALDESGSSAPVDLVDAVLRELREVAPVLTSGTVNSRCPVPETEGTEVMDALEHVVTHVDPDLGFRLFLRVLAALSVPLTRERYERYQAIGERLGYGEYHVSCVDYLVETG
ncbi:hypothetical protein AB0912_02295 [Streptomyces sp. NPDC007084]|uniref:hypothetical protein n=1 Tax=Streptomyces sp. NPDC007084 TaxID=3154313 RepID=UPI003452ED9A